MFAKEKHFHSHDLIKIYYENDVYISSPLLCRRFRFLFASMFEALRKKQKKRAKKFTISLGDVESEFYVVRENLFLFT